MKNELTLSDLYNLIKSKLISIICFAAAFCFISLMYNYYMLVPIYKVTSLISITQNPNDILDLNQFINTGKSDAVIDKMISDLKLKKVGVKQLRDSTSYYLNGNNSDLFLEVIGQKPEEIVTTANYLAKKTSEQIQQVSRAKKTSTYQARIDELEMTISTLEAKLKEANELLQVTPMILRTTKQQATNKETQEEINPVYIEIDKIIAETKIELSKLTVENALLVNDNSIHPIVEVFLSEAVKPTEPINGKTAYINIIIFTVFGTFLGLVVVFIRYYLSSVSATYRKENN